MARRTYRNYKNGADVPMPRKSPLRTAYARRASGRAMPSFSRYAQNMSAMALA